MRTNRTIVLAMTLCLALASHGQDWSANPGGNILGGTEYLGASAGSTQPLRLTTIPNLAIEFRTNNTRRMRLYPSQSPNINGFTVPTNGFLGLSGNANFFNGVGPFSRLHLADNSFSAVVNAQQFGFRAWQRNGITFTGNADHGYIGQKFNGLDNTDFVLLWSNDPSSGLFAPDRLTIRFASSHTGAPSGANSLEGLEAARFFPVDNTQVNMGLGDFFAGNLVDPTNVTEPTERLDILTGRARIRQLPDNDPADSEYLVMVVDASSDPDERGVVKWVDPNDLPGGGGADCDWLVGETPDEPHVTTVWSSGTCDWDNRHGVGIGRPVPKSKLDVYHDNTELLSPVSIYGMVNLPADPLSEIVGVWGVAEQANDEATVLMGVGTRGVAHRTRFNVGVQGQGFMDGSDVGTADVVCGVMGIANATGNATLGVGVYGRSMGATTDWAGGFDGDIVVFGDGISMGGMWIPSDMQFKSNVEELVNATELVAQLRPKTYNYQLDEFPTMNFPEGLQAGFLAQELEAIVPWAVKEVVVPGTIDIEAGTISPSVEFKAVNYPNLIPLLVAGMQEQQAQIAAEQASNASLMESLDELRERMNQLEQIVAQCCNRPEGSMLAPQDELHKADPKTERLLRMDPNPFTDQTTVRYTLERGGRVSLLVHGSAGQHIQVLHEAPMEQGEYSQIWRTSHLAPGIYYVTLLLDGEPLVKRAVKVQ